MAIDIHTSRILFHSKTMCNDSLANLIPRECTLFYVRSIVAIDEGCLWRVILVNAMPAVPPLAKDVATCEEERGRADPPGLVHPSPKVRRRCRWENRPSLLIGVSDAENEPCHARRPTP